MITGRVDGLRRVFMAQGVGVVVLVFIAAAITVVLCIAACCAGGLNNVFRIVVS